MIRITGYFQSIYNAQKTYNQFKKKGYKNVALDIIDRFPKNTDLIRENVLGGDEGSLSALVLKPGEGEFSMEARPMLAADPNVSGMAGFSEIADANIMVSVSVEKEEEEAVRGQIKDNDGDI